MPLPVPKGFANTVPHPIEEIALFEVGNHDDEMDNVAQGKTDWENQIDSFQTVMAMARTGAAKGSGKGQYAQAPN